MEISKQQSLEIKGIAVLLLLFHHFFYYTNIIFVKEFAAYSKITVGFFIFLSGYGLAASFSVSELKSVHFFKKNMIKLYKTYIPIFLLSIFIGEISKIRTIREVYGKNFIKILLDMFGILYFFEGITFNATWWYMSLIVILYIIFSIFYKSISNIKKFQNRVIVLTIISLLLLILPKIIKNDLIFKITKVTYGFDYIVLFGVGILSKINSKEIKIYFGKNKQLLLLVFSILSIVRVYKFGTKLDIVLVFLFCGLYSVYSKKNKLNFFKTLGTYSFEIFLTHTFIYYYYLPNFTRLTKYESVNFIWFLTLSILITFLINKFLNKVFLKRVHV